jgi:hypothetical protein
VNPNDAAQNIQGGIEYLAQMLNEFGGDVSKALAAYNWGPGNVTKAVNSLGPNWLSSAPAETQNYVASILSALGMSSMSIFPAVAALSVAGFPAWAYWLGGAGLGLLVLASIL